ncbi:MAG: hypothetical protein HOV83_01915 [Catenulispora sp.]|nr:hypothetical protein [Catenulispora sp.]
MKRRSDLIWTGGAAVLVVLCCAGPLLVAGGIGGALGLAGAWLRNPWVLGAGVLVVLAGLGYALVLRARGHRIRGGRRPRH